MPRNRRVAAVCGGCAAAIAGSTALFHNLHHSGLTDAMQGIFIGLLLGISITAFIKSRRSCT